MILTHDKIKGLVLLGGKSTRMGSPKAYLEVAGQPQWRRCQSLLSNYCQEVFFSVSPQLVEMPPVPTNFLIPDIFAQPIGPLGGIISAFKKDCKHAWFVLACDLLHFDAQAAQSLIEGRDTAKMATAFSDAQGRVEPLCSIYEPTILGSLMQAWASGECCPRKILTPLDIKVLQPKQTSWIANINQRAEYEAWVRLPALSLKRHVLVSYYAAMREAAGKNQENVATQAKTVGELFLHIKERYRLALSLDQMRFAKNERLVFAHELIFDGDCVVFIPPVSGG